MSDEFITLPRKDYDRLKKRNAWLSCLEVEGVDNWIGYNRAVELMEELKKEELE